MDLRIKTPLTNSDMRRILPAVKDRIVEYSDLNAYGDLEEILPEHKSFIIILIEYKQNSGHWVCLSRYGDTIEMFNSFGTKHGPDDFVESASMNRYLGQATMHLRTLLRKEAAERKFNVVFNQVKFQGKDLEINTCGRHVLLRLVCLLEFDMDLKEYIRFMRRARKKTRGSYDELVSSIIY